MANEHETTDIKALIGQLKDLQPILEKWEATPTDDLRTDAPQGVKTPSITAFDNYMKVVELRQSLFGESQQNLYRMIGQQLVAGAGEGRGIPVNKWADGATARAMQEDDALVKLLDTAGGTAMIRQDLEPLLYAAFVQSFPWWERISKIPSNGLVHAFNRIDELPTATFIGDLGLVPDSTSKYTRATTNIAIAAVRVGTGLKLQFAVQAGGMGFNPETLEIRNGITSIAKKMQGSLFSGNASVPGKTASDPEGLYDANGFDGLRVLVPAANIQALGTDPILEALNKTDALMSVTGGSASVILMDGRDRVTLMNELQPAVRLAMPRAALAPGLPEVEQVSLGVSGLVPIIPIPGNELGAYTVGVDSVRDAYLVNEATVDVPWLGSEMPTVLDIPIGVAGQLTHLFILFMMGGFAMRVPTHNAKLRIVQ